MQLHAQIKKQQLPPLKSSLQCLSSNEERKVQHNNSNNNSFRNNNNIRLS